MMSDPDSNVSAGIAIGPGGNTSHDCHFGIISSVLIAVLGLMLAGRGARSVVVLSLFAVAGLWGGCSLMIWFGLRRGLPRIDITTAGVSVTTVFTRRWAKRSSLTNFAVNFQIMDRARKPVAMATIAGDDVSGNLRNARVFLIQNVFNRPIKEIVNELNGARPPGLENWRAAQVPNKALLHERMLNRNIADSERLPLSSIVAILVTFAYVAVCLVGAAMDFIPALRR